MPQKPKNFNSPTDLPNSKKEAEDWQRANRDWWQDTPMRYDWKKSISYQEFSRPFYQEIDKRFFENAQEYLGNEKIPFDSIIDFNSLQDKDVLEIGIGNGSHAQFLSKYTKSFTGIDITDYSIKNTKKRFDLFNLDGKILKMDAEDMTFSDSSFDFIWSWGVIHHSSNPYKIIREISRVLRPKGEVYIMIYHRGWWNYHVMEVLWGLFSGKLMKLKSLHKSVQVHSDGAIARFYSIADWKKLTGDFFDITEIKCLGPKSDLIPLPGSRLKKIASKLISNTLNRFLVNKFRMGSFLISELIQK